MPLILQETAARLLAREQAKALQAKDVPDPDRQLSLYL